jgi:uncharacterized repeat protein (TIGR01451 family)
VGETVTFTVTLTNAGPDTATNVQVRDVLPSGLSYVSNSPDQGNYASATGVWTVGTVTAGDSLELDIVATVTTSGTKINTAQVSDADQFDPDSTPNNGIASEDDQDDATVTPQVADLSLTKTVDQSAPGINDNVTFTIRLSNDGPDTATNVEVRDVLPAGLSYVSNSPDRGSYNSATGEWTVGTIAVGETLELDIVATVDTAGTKINTAEVSAADQFDSDSTPDNDVAAEDDQDEVSVTPRVASISGYVYVDLDKDGQRDSFDLPVEGVEIRLTSTDGFDETVTTLADGSWEFIDLAPGTYTVIETQPTQWVDGPETQGTPTLGTVGDDTFVDLVLEDGMDATDYDFLELLPVISKRRFLASSETDL